MKYRRRAMIVDEPDKVWPQYLLAIVCNLGTLCFGLHVGWLSPLQDGFMSENNPLGPDVPPFTLEEISWIASIPCFILIVGPFLFGYLLQLIGRRLTLVIVTIPNIIALIMLIFAKSLAVVYIARAIAGLAVCIFVITPIYVNECVEDNIRGKLGGLSGISINVGIVLAYIFGGFTSYITLNIVAVIPSIVLLGFCLWIPETPQYLVVRNRREDAIAAVHKLRGGTLEKNEEVVDRMFQMVEKSKNLNANQTMSPLTIIKQRTFIRGVFIIMSIFFIQQFSGISGITAYSVTIFEESGVTIAPILASIIMSVLLVAGSCIGTMTVERYGRRMLLLTSACIDFIALFSLTMYLWFKPDPVSPSIGWLPVLSLSLYMTAYGAGFGTICYVLLPELFPPQARPYSSSICGTWISILTLIMLKFFPLVNREIGLAASCTIFTSVVFGGIFFIYFFVFETKNKTISEILVNLGGRPEQIKTTNNYGATSLPEKEKSALSA